MASHRGVRQQVGLFLGCFHAIAGALAFRWDGRRSRFYFQTRPGTYKDVGLIGFLRQLEPRLAYAGLAHDRHDLPAPCPRLLEGSPIPTASIPMAILSSVRFMNFGLSVLSHSL
jgi:hypothetical protein